MFDLRPFFCAARLKPPPFEERSRRAPPFALQEYSSEASLHSGKHRATLKIETDLFLPNIRCR